MTEQGGLPKEEDIEMSELIESDPELNYGDDDEDYGSSTESDSGKSLGYERHGRAKRQKMKINNSFTGPYPLDPSDFDHRDKGENHQFTKHNL